MQSGGAVAGPARLKPQMRTFFLIIHSPHVLRQCRCPRLLTPMQSIGQRHSPKSRKWDRLRRPTLRMRGRPMSIFVQFVGMLILVTASRNPALADEHPDVLAAQARLTPTDQTIKTAADNNVDQRRLPRKVSFLAPSQERGDKTRAAPSQEPFGLPAFDEAPPDFSAKWADLQSRMLSEEGILAACRSNDGNCSAVGRRSLNIIDMGVDAKVLPAWARSTVP